MTIGKDLAGVTAEMAFEIVSIAVDLVMPQCKFCQYTSVVKIG